MKRATVTTAPKQTTNVVMSNFDEVREALQYALEVHPCEYFEKALEKLQCIEDDYDHSYSLCCEFEDRLQELGKHP